MKSITYPNAPADLVVLGFRGGRRVSFTVRPILGGLFRILVWPASMADPAMVRHTLLEFLGPEGSPAHAAIDLSDEKAGLFTRWEWALVPTNPDMTVLQDLTRGAFEGEAAARGAFTLSLQVGVSETRVVAWSCHMPFETADDGRAILGGESQRILEWYANQVEAFSPHVVWGAGDTAYSDGTEATDFSSQVYENEGWQRNRERIAWLRTEYRRMYRHYWSLEPMRRIMGAYPHLFIWDDHEIHDGWGSEGRHFSPGNLQMFEVAKEVAGEYILNSGPRVRPRGGEAHQAYVLNGMASFIFDTRSTRNYESRKDRLISRSQFDDFVAFLDSAREHPRVTDLVLNTTVPFVGLKSWVTSLITRAPHLLNDNLLQGVRDDVRDGWTSPGNIETLSAVLDALRRFMGERPEVRVINVSGDIHVANAFEIHVPGASRPIYQLTSSAITNRHHPPDALASVIEISSAEDIEGVGQVRRIWDTVTDPNVLFMRIGAGGSEFTLKVKTQEADPSPDLSLAFH